jgi:hypothetical protein
MAQYFIFLQNPYRQRFCYDEDSRGAGDTDQTAVVVLAYNMWPTACGASAAGSGVDQVAVTPRACTVRSIM